MGDVDESLLIARLESPDYVGLGQLFATHLSPLCTLFRPDCASKNRRKTPKVPSKIDTDQRHSIRSLAKRFLPFISRALSVLPKRLSELAKSQRHCEVHGSELFDAYRVCLRCLDCISSELSCKPYSVIYQKVQMMHCLETWGRYCDVKIEGFAVLEGLRNLDIFSEGKKGVKENIYVPSLIGEVDADLPILLVEVVVTLVKCISLSGSENDEDYGRVVVMADEVSPWFRVLDGDTFRKMNLIFVSYLQKCTLFVIEKLLPCRVDTVHKFCSTTLTAISESSTKDQISRLVRRMCSALFGHREELASCVAGFLPRIFDFMVDVYRVKEIISAFDFLDLIGYCVEKCLSASMPLCNVLALQLNRLADDLFHNDVGTFQIILRLYSARLHLADCHIIFKAPGPLPRCPQILSVLESVLSEGEVIQAFSALNGSLQKSVGILGVKDDDECSDALWQSEVISSFIERDDVPHAGCESKDRRTEYICHYFRAVKVLCQPLSELILSEKKCILPGSENERGSSTLCRCLKDTFVHIWMISLIFYKQVELEERELFDSSRTLSSVSVAAFILSLREDSDAQRAFKLMQHVMQSNWIQHQGLKFLYVSLYNIGVVLYRNESLSEAAKVLKLSNQASWACVLLFCRMVFGVSKNIRSDLSETEILNFINDATSKSSVVLDVLCQQHADCEFDDMVLESLEGWEASQALFMNFPFPDFVVRQWVKMKCRRSKDVNVDGSGNLSTLYQLLSSSRFTVPTIGVILGQELLEYEAVQGSYPKFSHQMQIEITDVLLNKVYISGSTLLERSKILVRRSRILRSAGGGAAALKDSIHCLTEAISGINSVYPGACGDSDARDWLSSCYFFRALCTQESEPKSGGIYEDIGDALNVLTSTPNNSKDRLGAAEAGDVIPENVFILLGHITDLLSVKGCTKFHRDIFRLTVRFFEKSGASPDGCLPFIWEFRRFRHALCVAPISEEHLADLCGWFGERAVSMEFWISCLRKNSSSLTGFLHHFSVSTASPGHHLSPESEPSWFNFSKEEVKCAASSLVTITGAPLSSRSAILSSFLYYDLSEKLMSDAKLAEALSYAKEAHKLRSKLLQQNFSYSVDLQDTVFGDDGAVQKRGGYFLRDLLLHNSVAAAALSVEKAPLWNSEAQTPTPWNVLQCYLESTLQVGIISEMVGNEREAEILLSSGREISRSHGLRVLDCHFSRVLGKLNRKKFLWDLAEKDVRRAKQLSTENNEAGDFSCPRCNSILEATIDQELGDLVRLRRRTALYAEQQSARDHYESSIAKLNLSVWKNSTSCPEEKTRSQRTGPRPARSADAHGGSGNRNRDTKWHGLVLDVINSGSLRNFTDLKWELARRRLLSALLTALGKCARERSHETRENFSRAIFAMESRSAFPTREILTPSLFELAATPGGGGDPFAIERSSLIHDICWFSLKHCNSSKAKRGRGCCVLSGIPLRRMASLLSASFLRSKEVPLLAEKISRLLVIITLYATVKQPFPSPLNGELSGNYRSAFFHQAALGGVDLNGVPASSEKDVDGVVRDFFDRLPRHAVIVCVSFLGDEYVDLMGELSACWRAQAWMLVSRMSAGRDPINILVPVGSIGDGKNGCPGFTAADGAGTKWDCPWGDSGTLMNEAAPSFRAILEENYVSSSVCPSSRTGRAAWWDKRKELDRRLGEFLKDMEEAWLGPWKHVMASGEWSEKPTGVNDSAAEVLLRGPADFAEVDSVLLDIFLTGGCFIGGGNVSGAVATHPGVSRSVLAASSDSPLFASSEPLILVLDRRVQMLPWESMPLLRSSSREVYRMPSVLSIHAMMMTMMWKRRQQQQLHFPSIDPLDAFYLLNPSGDLQATQLEFEDWFRHHRFRGVVGAKPSGEELVTALGNHDLYIYFGHGSGSQYVGGHEIEKLERCAATLLMGCSSGSLSVTGCYPQRGPPLSYLLAGSPVVVANLWEVTDRDIDRFGKAVLEGCIRQRHHAPSSSSTPRVACLLPLSRQACLLPFLIGASPVCYGIPTTILPKV